MKTYLFAFTDGSFRVVTEDARPNGITDDDRELIGDEAVRVLDITNAESVKLVEADGSTTAIETIEDPDEPLPTQGEALEDIEDLEDDDLDGDGDDDDDEE